MADVSQVERQLHILSMISESKRGYSIDEILSHLERIGIDVSRKTVERDIDSISFNFFVSEDKYQGKTLYKAKKYGVDNISFNLKELMSLHFIREILKFHQNIDVGVTALEVIDKMMGSISNVNKAFIEALSDMVKISASVLGQEKGLKDEHLNLIRDAISLRKKLNIKYQAFNSGELSERNFDPYLLEIKNGCYYLVGLCNLRGAVRSFRVTRIVDLRLLEDSFVKPENFYEDYQKSRFIDLSGENEVVMKLKFSGMGARIVKEYDSSKADKLEELENGIVNFERRTALTEDLINWVIGYGDMVEVIEPQELKVSLVDRARRILEKYT